MQHSRLKTPVALVTVLVTMLATLQLLTAFSGAAVAADNPNKPASPVKLVFVHHSSGEYWLNDLGGDDHSGGLGTALAANNYFVSDTNYAWGPEDADLGGTIGDHTYTGSWYNWFRGPHSGTYLSALYPESGQNCSYSRMGSDPGGENTIVMFKSCFPNSGLGGGPSDPVPAIGANPLRGATPPTRASSRSPTPRASTSTCSTTSAPGRTSCS